MGDAKTKSEVRRLAKNQQLRLIVRELIFSDIRDERSECPSVSRLPSSVSR